MSFVWIIVAASVVAPLLLAALIRNRRMAAGGNLDEISARLREVDVDCFRNLIDPAEQEYLCARLSPWQFRRIHFHRMLAATEYVRGAAMNARIMNTLAEAAKRDASPAAMELAENLQQNAFQVSLYAFQVIPRLLLSAIAPGLDQRAELVAGSYATAMRQIVLLRTLRSSDRAMSFAGRSGAHLLTGQIAS